MEPVIQSPDKTGQAFDGIAPAASCQRGAEMCERAYWSRVGRIVGWVGVILAVPFFVWALLGWFGVVPSMVSVFGITGLRIPASVVVAGLLMAAVGFHEF